MPFGTNGIAPPEHPVKIEPCGEVRKKQLQLIETRFLRVTVEGFLIMPDDIHAMIFLHEKAGGASPSPTVILKYRLIPSQNILFTSPSGEISYRRYFICRVRQISLAEGEYHCATAAGSCAPGDHEVVEGASGHNSRKYGFFAGGYGIRPYEKQDKAAGDS